MACHELAMAVKDFNLRKDLICQLSVLPRTVLEKRGSFEDFRSACFAIRTKEHCLRFEIDRCGGDWCGIQVGNAPLRTLPSETESYELEQKLREDSDIQRYFLLQDNDYVRMLSAVATAVANDLPFPDYVTNVAHGEEVVKLAEYIQEELKTFCRKFPGSMA